MQRWGVRCRIDADALLARALVAGEAAAGDGSGSDSDDSAFVDEGTGYTLLVTGQSDTSLTEQQADADAAMHGAAVVRKLGPLLLPVVQLYCRALLLLTKVLVLRPEALAPEVVALHPVVSSYLTGSTGSQLEPDAVVAATYVTLQFLELLLPQLRKQPEAAGAAAGSSDAAAGSATAALLPADIADKLQQQAATCSAALGQLHEDFAAKAKPPKAAGGKPSPERLAATQRAFAPKHPGSSSSSSGAADGGPGLLAQLQQLVVDVLAQLPAQKLCANPNCTTLKSLRRSCVRRGAVPARHHTAARNAAGCHGSPTSRCASGWQQRCCCCCYICRTCCLSTGGS